MQAGKIVQKFMEAYNRRNVDEYISYMHPNFTALLYDTEQLLCSNIEEARKIYTKRFSENPNIYVTTLNRIVNDNVVVDAQFIEGFDGGQTIMATSIFELEDNLIKRASFVRRVWDNMEKLVF
ncbi:nuclear transport factor 2 family protein [Spongiimicrobium sp. 3-5]|uniref:nuclear transport factor 2 family protein n=1 Tax=Spongiimicrobium sp. 3-5 TaxID=3332596 RepID=UPI003980A118